MSNLSYFITYEQNRFDMMFGLWYPPATENTLGHARMTQYISAACKTHQDMNISVSLNQQTITAIMYNFNSDDLLEKYHHMCNFQNWVRDNIPFPPKKKRKYSRGQFYDQNKFSINIPDSKIPEFYLWTRDNISPYDFQIVLCKSNPEFLGATFKTSELVCRARDEIVEFK